MISHLFDMEFFLLDHVFALYTLSWSSQHQVDQQLQQYFCISSFLGKRLDRQTKLICLHLWLHCLWRQTGTKGHHIRKIRSHFRTEIISILCKVGKSAIKTIFIAPIFVMTFTLRKRIIKQNVDGSLLETHRHYASQFILCRTTKIPNCGSLTNQCRQLKWQYYSNDC